MKLRTFFILFMVLLSGCQRKTMLSELNITGSDRVLTEQRYAVVKPAVLRVRSTPGYEEAGIRTLYRHDSLVVTLYTRQTGGWCRISGKEGGWVPVEELLLFRTIAELKSYQSAFGLLSENNRR